MTSWRLKCSRCGRVWVLKVSYNLKEMGRIYHWCPYCRVNTFHEVLERIDDKEGEVQD